MANNLFEPADRAAISARIAALSPSCARQWGKMTAAQMLAHCRVGLEAATGDRPMKHMLLGKIFGPFVRGRMLGDEPFQRDAPTHPDFRIQDDRDFDAEKKRLEGLVQKLVQRGPEQAGGATHAFLGRLSGEEWGRLMFKHLDHHLRQFGG